MNEIANPSTLVDLTQYEIMGLEARFNLADAHTHHRPTSEEQSIVAGLEKLWDEARVLTQGDVDARLLHTFFTFHGQASKTSPNTRSLLSYAASISMSVVATYLRLHRLSVTLIEPCFDNLYELLVQNELSINPIDETVLASSADLSAALREAQIGDALVLVDPNNPTGTSSLLDGAGRFETIVRHCAQNDILLVLDFSFAASLIGPGRSGRPDVYAILDAAGVRYLSIEDTGKTWATQDLKCGILSTSEDLWEEIRDLHTGVILNVSPVSLLINEAFVRSSLEHGVSPLNEVSVTNRRMLAESLEGSRFAIISPPVPVSVAWIEITSGPDAVQSQGELASRGVFVLPGTHFYWSDPARGSNRLRVALARDEDVFREAARVIGMYGSGPVK